MSPLVAFVLFYHLTSNICANEVTYVNNRHLLEEIPPQAPAKEETNMNDPKKKDENEGEVIINAESEPKAKVPPKLLETKQATVVSPATKKTTPAPAKNKSVTVNEHKPFKTAQMESGAFLRGVSVLVVLTTIVIVYLGLRTYCGRKGKNPVMVRKYGVRTHRSDIEMTPLPLDDDEEDETLFEVHNTNR